jgi:hypothetical protein
MPMRSTPTWWHLVCYTRGRGFGRAPSTIPSSDPSSNDRQRRAGCKAHRLLTTRGPGTIAPHPGPRRNNARQVSECSGHTSDSQNHHSETFALCRGGQGRGRTADLPIFSSKST